MTLDYEEDLAFFKTIFNHFNCTENDVSLKEIVTYLVKHPEIPELNSSRHQDWATNQKKHTKLVLKNNWQN